MMIPSLHAYSMVWQEGGKYVLGMKLGGHHFYTEQIKWLKIKKIVTEVI